MLQLYLFFLSPPNPFRHHRALTFFLSPEDFDNVFDHLSATAKLLIRVLNTNSIQKIDKIEIIIQNKKRIIKQMQKSHEAELSRN